MATASFDTQLIKGEILQYLTGLIPFIKNNTALGEQSFQSVPLGDKYLKHHTLQPGKKTSRRTLLKIIGKAITKYC